MLFHTPAFLALMLVTLVFYYAFPRGRLWILALANMVFYGLPNPAHLLLFLGACPVTYWGARRGRLGFGLALAANVANLVFFKYALFFTRSLERLAGIPLPAADSFLVQVVLPVGISFYTFQLIAYLVDVRAGRIAPAGSVGEFWVFISLFPQLIAGPIVRGAEMLPQLAGIRGIRFADGEFGRGLLLFLGGMVKKVVLADSLAPFVDNLFALGPDMGGVNAWLAAYLFAFQIYFDFSAYSDMAVGIGAMLGFRLPQNFRTPYLSAGPSEFWSRWHVTLSTWIRDYIYIPLGGSRRGLPRQLVNLVAAMAFSGLWHGAGWTFVVWGLYHGVLSVGEKLVRVTLVRLTGRSAGPTDATLAEPATVPRLVGRALSVLIYFHLVVLGWVFFRAGDPETALAMVKSMLAPGGFSLDGVSRAVLLAVPALYLLHLVEHLVRRDGVLPALWRSRVPAALRGLAYAVVIILVMTFMGSEQNSFIYFRF